MPKYSMEVKEKSYVLDHTPNRRCRYRRLRLRHLKRTFTCDLLNRRLQTVAVTGTCDIIKDPPATDTCGGTFYRNPLPATLETGDFKKSHIPAPPIIYETYRRPAPATAPMTWKPLPATSKLAPATKAATWKRCRYMRNSKCRLPWPITATIWVHFKRRYESNRM